MPHACERADCDGTAEARGLCGRHYQKLLQHGDAGGGKTYSRRGAPLIDRLEASMVKTAHCWIWAKHLNGDGYGVIRVGGRIQMAHRVSYEVHVGPIPDGLVIDHLCRNRACMRPDHLEPVSHAENVRRGASMERKTHCSSGHEFTEENTYWVRHCVTCQRESRKRSKPRKLK